MDRLPGVQQRQRQRAGVYQLWQRAQQALGCWLVHLRLALARRLA